MIAYQISESTRLLILKLLLDPVFAEILKDYSLDDKFLYIPKNRLQQNSRVINFIDNGKLKIIA